MTDAIESPNNSSTDLAESPDLQEMLPAELRSKWRILPRWIFYYLLSQGMLLGAGLSVSIVGIIAGSKVMESALLFSMAAIVIQGWRFGQIERKAREEARKSLPEK